MIKKNSYFILENFFLKTISNCKFRKKYLNDFISEEYKFGDYLFKQNTELDYVYFISEIKVHLKIYNTNLIQINEMIKSLCDNLKITNIPFSKIFLYLDFGKNIEL